VFGDNTSVKPILISTYRLENWVVNYSLVRLCEMHDGFIITNSLLLLKRNMFTYMIELVWKYIA
jgi:hypothetical protein